MGHMVKGALGAFVVHLIGFAICFGTTAWLTSVYEDASDKVKVLGDGSAAPESDVLLALGDARAAMLNWLLAIFVIGFICALLFLLRSANAKAAVPEQQEALKPMWVILLLGLFGLGVGLWLAMLYAPGAAFAMEGGHYAQILSLSFALLLLSYFASTLLFVKPLLAPSVPLAPLIRRL